MNKLYKYTFIKDLLRCPYAPLEPGYEYWSRQDDARLANLSHEREHIKLIAKTYSNHENRDIRQMAAFIDWFLED